MFTAPFLTALMQVGPNPSAPATLGVPEELTELRRRQRAAQSPQDAPPERLGQCLARADDDATAVVMEESLRATRSTGKQRAEALHCRGYASAVLGQWRDAATAFADARDAADAADHSYRGRLGAMAGNALLNAGDLLPALSALDSAQVDADAADFAALSGEIALDRALALVALGDLPKASDALAEARRVIPLSARAWLLSATLARRQDQLDLARDTIAQARSLDATNPDILLEAGVIAVLTGDDATARTYWDAVLALPATSLQAATARDYLSQLGQ